jgi:hypothetical protein
MEKNLTAVEWLVEQLNLHEYEDVIKQTKEMEKEKMCKFAYKCHNHYKVYGDFKIEEYYNKTFKSE